ncbi:MAG: SCO family protein [Acidobacteriota bacterium]
MKKAIYILFIGLIISFGILIIRGIYHSKSFYALKPGDLIPDAILKDQDGREFFISDLKGNILCLAFIYTRCNVPSMCPSVTEKLVRTKDLLINRGFNRVIFILISFDPSWDTPDRLKEYASQYDVDYTFFRFASGDPQTIANLSRAFNIYYREASNGIFEHNIVVSLIDQNGILRKYFLGTEWRKEDLISEIEFLIK